MGGGAVPVGVSVVVGVTVTVGVLVIVGVGLGVHVAVEVGGTGVGVRLAVADGVTCVTAPDAGAPEISLGVPGDTVEQETANEAIITKRTATTRDPDLLAINGFPTSINLSVI